MAGVHAFDSDEKLSVLLEFVLVSETDLGQGSASTGIVQNVFHNSLDVSVEKGGNAKVRHTKSEADRLMRLTYPLRSAKSRVLKAAGATLLEVWALKIVLPPRLCTKHQKDCR